ncbi:cytokine receptor-like factor 2, partial [Sorex fumeus]|uniref:cytokine receptor-like factor 2 n=1 Tax=Sorex fumeus TaxID=62283 RepID=UPI0024ADE37F
HALDVQLVNFNYEFLQVTWNASGHGTTNLTFWYKLSNRENFTQCPQYLLQGGLTSGCHLQQKLEDVMLYLQLRNGSDLVLSRNMYISDYLKPASPGRLHFQWLEEDALTVTCAGLNFPDLLYEIQHRTVFDSEWQSQAEETCNVTILGVDAHKCYSFRARVRTQEHSYGPDAHPSDWSPVVHQQGRTRAESCPPPPPPDASSRTLPKFVVACGLVVVLTLLLTPLSLWKLQRVKRILLPSVPDPRVTFPGLFDTHQGDFQEWIEQTQNVGRMDTSCPDRAPEETLLVPWTVEESPSPAVTTAPSLPPESPERTPGPPPGDDSQLVHLQEFTFVLHDDAYVTF